VRVKIVVYEMLRADVYQRETIDQDDQPELIHVLKLRLYKVFTSLFWTPTDATMPATFMWKDFKDALCAIGFVAEKMFGSTWLFYRDGWNGILFCAPRPEEEKIPYATARNWGRRLRVNFGFELDQFQLHSADKAKKSKKSKKKKKKGAGKDSEIKDEPTNASDEDDDDADKP
jgi:hypothetical protein